MPPLRWKASYAAVIRSRLNLSTASSIGQLAKDSGLSIPRASEAVSDLTDYGVMRSRVEIMPDHRDRAPKRLSSLPPDWEKQLVYGLLSTSS